MAVTGFVQLESFQRRARFDGGQMACAERALEDGVEFNPRQFAGSQSRRSVGQLPDTLRASGSLS